MHKLFFIPLTLFFIYIGNPMFSQKDTSETMGGVYLSLDDYKTGRLTYDIDCAMEKQKIKLYDFMAKPYFDVWHKGQKIRLQKNEVYGFKNCHDETYRFYENMEYQLVEVGNFCIYKQDQMFLADKAGEVSHSYFISSTPGGALKPLNNVNLKNAYPDNKVFHKLLDANLYSRNISEYDSLHKMYRVNQLYLESLSKK